VVVVSSRSSDEDLVHGLGVGADEFVTKPFSPKVLVARVAAHLRRARTAAAPRPAVYRFGVFACDVEAGTLSRAGARVAVAAREIDLLGYLLRASPRAVGVEELYRAVWGNQYGERGTVAVHVQRVRRKIEDDPSNPRFIRHIQGKGYQFDRDTLVETP
jgi:two-component system response regulator RegX3